MSDDDLCLLCGHTRADHFAFMCFHGTGAADPVCDCAGFLDPETC